MVGDGSRILHTTPLVELMGFHRMPVSSTNHSPIEPFALMRPSAYWRAIFILSLREIGVIISVYMGQVKSL